MQHGLWIRNGTHDANAVLEMAVAADESGWDGVFVSDAVMMGSHTEPFTLLAAVAARTERVLLGTWVTPLIARDVVHVARSAINVDHLSGGRLLLGLGLGNPEEHETLGVPRDRLGEHYDAAVEVLAALLAGEEVTRHDDWFDLDEVALGVRALQEPRPPILIGCNWPAPAPMRRAARWDGAMPYWPGLGEGADPDVEEGARDRELRALLDVYRDDGGDGIVVAPTSARHGPEFTALCEELGVQWMLHCDPFDVDGVRGWSPA